MFEHEATELIAFPTTSTHQRRWAGPYNSLAMSQRIHHGAFLAGSRAAAFARRIGDILLILRSHYWQNSGKSTSVLMFEIETGFIQLRRAVSYS